MFYVTTSDPKQRQLWQHLFQLEALPVKRPFPHEVMCADGGSRWFYTLEPMRMTMPQLHRLAGYLSQRVRSLSHGMALAQVMRDGWDIDAEYCKLAESRPAFSYRQLAMV